MENYEQKKEKSPMEITDDVLEQVSGGISEPVKLVGSEGPIEPCRDMIEVQLQQLHKEGNYGTETEKIV